MIRVHRPSDEPSALTEVRLRELPQRRLSPSHDITGYGVVKDDLFRVQFCKCCYCEKQCAEASYNDVEHYRPKSRYWWLAWTWANVLFACPQCNRSYKRDQFPLAPGSQPLIAEQAPPGLELPLVLDPASAEVDPVDIIEFRSIRMAGQERWRPFPRVVDDPRGVETIRVCGLDRDELWEAYANHVNRTVRREINEFSRVIDEGDERRVVHAWQRLTRRLLGARAPFAGLSFDALRVLVPSEVLGRFRLEIQKPPVWVVVGL